MAQNGHHGAKSRTGQTPQERVLEEILRVGRAIDLVVASQGEASPAVRPLLRELSSLHEKLKDVMQAAKPFGGQESPPVPTPAAPPSATAAGISTGSGPDLVLLRLEGRLDRSDRELADLKSQVGRLVDVLLRREQARRGPAAAGSATARGGSAGAAAAKAAASGVAADPKVSSAATPVEAPPRSGVSAGEHEALQRRNAELERELRRHHDVEAGLLTTMRDIRAASQAKSDFLANMSHELRTPLNAIIGFSEIMESELVGPLGTPQYKTYSRDIREAGQHLLEVINDILDLSKIESGRLELDAEDVDLRATVDACTRMVHDQAKEAGLSLVLDAATDLPTIRANARMVRQILMNLLSNAIKFTRPGGSVTVRLRHDADANTALVAVSDTGIGIDRREIPRILRPFEQVETAQSERRRGTGLGLPLAKSLTELHGGTFDIDSEMGVGTTIRVVLPVER